MLKLKHILLGLSLAGMAVGLCAPSTLQFLDFALPIGAALFGMFLIVRALESESALMDEQNHALQPVSHKRDHGH